MEYAKVRIERIQMIVSQNADFILGARKAVETNTAEPERTKWLALPCVAGGPATQIKPQVDQGVLRAAVVTSLTMDTGLEMLVQAMKGGAQPPEKTFVEAYSYPNLAELAKKRDDTQ
jgi:hypothetical protein